jgi:methylation protein EvaC
MNCRICDSKLEPFMTFGMMPIANGFLTAEQVQDEFFFELAPGFCENCGMFQLIEQPSPDKMFHENYAFFSSTSVYMQEHFKRFAGSVIDLNLKGRSDPFVVELGSNDGVMLRNFKDQGFRILGIEPSQNVADVARNNGVDTISEFFNKDFAERIVSDYGHADAVLAANVMCHIPDLNSVAEGISLLLKPDGFLVFEDPYLGDVISKTSFDQIYDEHVFTFSAASVTWAFGRHGMELVDVMPQVTHGGSMRYVLAHRGSHTVTPAVKTQLNKEREQGLDRLETYLRFKTNCEITRDHLMKTLESLRDQRKRIVGYGATSKSATVTNYCGITPAHLEFISDTTPIKQGKLSPGAHIPVRPYEEFQKHYPDYALLFAWNHSAEIREKEKSFMNSGGRWIVYVPKVGITS